MISPSDILKNRFDELYASALVVFHEKIQGSQTLLLRRWLTVIALVLPYLHYPRLHYIYGYRAYQCSQNEQKEEMSICIRFEKWNLLVS